MTTRRIFKTTDRKKISKKALNKISRHRYYGHLICLLQEHMQTFGYLTSMLPTIEELYDRKDDQKEAMKICTASFSIEPQLGSIIVGITARLEEAKANGDAVDGETINGMRAGLMGPIAGIGDSLIVGTLIPVLLDIALGMSAGGLPAGATFYIIVWNSIAHFDMRYPLFRGCEMGDRAVEFLVGVQDSAVRKVIGAVGVMAIGGVAATWVNIPTVFELKSAPDKVFLSLQKQFDSIYPELLTVPFILLCQWLTSKKKISAINTMLILVVITFVGVLVGFFNPGLKY